MSVQDIQARHDAIGEDAGGTPAMDLGDGWQAHEDREELLAEIHGAAAALAALGVPDDGRPLAERFTTFRTTLLATADDLSRRGGRADERPDDYLPGEVYRHAAVMLRDVIGIIDGEHVPQLRGRVFLEEENARLRRAVTETNTLLVERGSRPEDGPMEDRVRDMLAAEREKGRREGRQESAAELARLREIEAIRVAEIEAALDKHRAAFGVDMPKAPAALDEAAELAEHIDTLDRTDVSERDFDRALTRTIILVRKMLRGAKPCQHDRFPHGADAAGTYCTDCGDDVEQPPDADALSLAWLGGTREATIAKLPADIRAQVLALDNAADDP